MLKIFLSALILLTLSSISFAQTNLSFNNLSIRDSSLSPNYTLIINYPQIAGPQLTSAEKNFNRLMKDRIDQAVENFKQTVRENEKYPVPSEIKANGSSITIDYQVFSINKSFVSVRYGIDTFFSGAAHPTHTFRSLNYDLNLNKEFFLQNLFQPKSNYLQKIADYSSKQLKPKLKNNAFVEGFAPSPKNYQVWNITPKGLKITFNEYQVAAYVYGPQQAVIPFSNLKNILSDKTSVAKCFRMQNCQIKVFHSPKAEIKH